MPALQKALWDVRKAGLNIMMSMKGDGKPVSFIEDCAVPLRAPRRIHRPPDRRCSRSTARAAPGTRTRRSARCTCARSSTCAATAREDARDRRGSRRDGARVQGRVLRRARRRPGALRMDRAACSARGSRARSRRSRTLFDPAGLMNPGKIVRGTKHGRPQRCSAIKPGYAAQPLETGARLVRMGRARRSRRGNAHRTGDRRRSARGFGKAVEMCNNNGHCRKFDAGTMCPSLPRHARRAHLTRGRANTLRLALSGQLGADASRRSRCATRSTCA